MRWQNEVVSIEVEQEHEGLLDHDADIVII